MKKINLIVSVLALICSANLNGQIKVNCSGAVGIGKDANGSYNLDINSAVRTPSIYIDNLYSNTGGVSFLSYDSFKFLHPLPMYKTSVGINMTPTSTYSLDVNGQVRCTSGVWVSSDWAYKKNIEAIDGKTALNKLLGIQGKTYDFKTRDELLQLYYSGAVKFNVDTIRSVENNKDSAEIITEKLKIEVPEFAAGKNYGFIAQEIKDIFPELVSLDSLQGTYSISYTGFIPIMLEAIKEQNKIINALNDKIANIEANCCTANLKSALLATSTTANLAENQARLDQNVPNPFSQETRIGCTIPESSSSSALYIYNMNGIQLQQYNVNGKGQQTVTISGNSLVPGMYLYALVIDGKEVDTKRMILTK